MWPRTDSQGDTDIADQRVVDSAALVITKEDTQQARTALPYGHVRRPACSEDVDSANPYRDCAMTTVESSTNSFEQFGTL